MTTILDLPGEQLVRLWKQSGQTQSRLAAQYGVPYESLHSKISNASQKELRDIGREVLKPSPYPIYDKPLEMEGDVVVIPDPEFPFHHAEFMNRVLDLADTWGIKLCNIAGDALHFNSISKWEPNWTDHKKSGLKEEDEALLLDKINKLPQKYRDDFIEAVLKMSGEEKNDQDLGEEVGEAKKCLERLAQQFDQIDFVIGNHDGRLLSALNSPMFAGKILDFIGITDPKWRIAPYYFSYIYSGGEKFLIEHPKGSSDSTASQLADKFHCNVLMGHSHKWDMNTDRSAQYWAVHMGCCVDERRLPYAAQRHQGGKAHKLGAVIIRDGYPYLLEEKSPWKRLSALA